jgi:acylphosphatase
MNAFEELNLSVEARGCKIERGGYNSQFVRGEPSMAERRTILFGGRVQGVGFRMTAVHLGRDLAIWGTVRNLPDGRVELVAEGAGKEIDTLVARLREHFGAFVRTVEESAGARGVGADDGPAGIRVID